MTSIRADLGSFAPAVAETASRLEGEQVMARIARGDYTVWKPAPTEITDRLGWLTIATRMRAELPAIQSLVDDVREAGYTEALLLGMGGSSLAPEVFRRTFGVATEHLDLAVLDSTDPAAVSAHAQRLDPARTLFIVSTKSGGTVETFSFFRYFYRWTVRALGAAAAGAHFIAITDPGSGLVDTAKRYNFRATFLNDPNIGGRYSALSHFGLVPAALIGVDLTQLLDRATAAERETEPGAKLGVILGELAARRTDKVTFVLSPSIAAFAGWAEQLLAESTGKEGKGIVPIADEPLGAPGVYGEDRLFVHLRVGNDATNDAALDALRSAKYPVVRIDLSDAYDLGGQFFLWELATAVAGWRLGINPFDQPNVESAKVLTRELVKAYETSGSLPPLPATAHGDGLTVYTAGEKGTAGKSARELVHDFLKRARPGDYVALQAYVEPTLVMSAALRKLRIAIRDTFRVATTVGYGPRFLHSTGQLHKGDGGHSMFLQIVTPAPAADVPIPDTADGDASHIAFGLLKVAQSLGDRQALLDRGRRVLRVDPDDIPQDVARIATMTS
jgi:transaldolase / glucose-6-phosphate isomerase